MIDSLLSAAALFADAYLWLLLLGAVLIGLVLGILPGIGGLTGLALLIPLVYDMSPFHGLAFLLAMHAVMYTGGSVTAILLGIPGTSANAATVADGHALARQGRAAYAIGAALASSAAGGVVGVIVLLALLPVLKPVVMAFGSPETFLLSLLGIVFIGAMGDNRPIKGLVAGGLGIFLSTFGYHEVSGVPRFWLDFDYLLDGFRLVPLVLGLFAIPEVVALVASGSAIADSSNGEKIGWRQMLDGAAATFADKWLFLRSSAIGVLVGIMPGIGGDTAPFVAYAAGKQTARNGSRFGTGVIEGVVAPECSNNAKEGGAMVPTLAFGIPGSAGMAVLLGAFLILGLEPGPEFLSLHMDIAIGLAFVIATANVVAAVILFGTARRATLITRVRGHILAPVLMVLVVIGAYVSAHNMNDVWFVFIFGLLGYLMRRYGFSRPALLLGFVLGAPIERYFSISYQAYGPWFVLRPISLVLTVLLIGGLIWALVRGWRGKRNHGLA